MSIPAEIKILGIAIATYFSLELFGAPDWAAIMASVFMGEFLMHDERASAKLEYSATRLQTIITTKALEIHVDIDDIKDKLENLVNQVQALEYKVENFGDHVQTLADRSEGIEAEVGRITTEEEAKRRIRFGRRLADAGCITVEGLDELMELEKSQK